MWKLSKSCSTASVTHVHCWIFTLSGLISRGPFVYPPTPHPRAMLMTANREGGGVGVLEGRKLLDGEVLSAQGDCIYLALFISCLCFSSWWLVSESFPSRPPEEETEATKDCFILLSWCLLFLPVFFLSVLFLEDERWASQKAVHSHATAASKLISLSPFWCCIYLRVQSCVQLVCLTGWTIKSPCGMLMSSYFTAQHTAGSLWSVCTANQRLTEAMGLARLAENMTGVLICQQVVSLNDGRADSPVECSSEWVGCGMTVWGHPTFSHGAPSVNETRPHRKLPPPPPPCYLFKEEAQNWLEFSTCTSSYLAAPTCYPPPCLPLWCVWR